MEVIINNRNRFTVRETILAIGPSEPIVVLDGGFWPRIDHQIETGEATVQVTMSNVELVKADALGVVWRDVPLTMDGLASLPSTITGIRLNVTTTPCVYQVAGVM